MGFQILSRFEPLFSSYKNEMLTLLIEPKADLIKFQRIALEIMQSNQGKIVFLQGKPGIGKSTFAYGLPKFLSEYYQGEIRVPSRTFELKLNDIPEYIYKNLTQGQKISIVTIDNRESPKYKEEDLNDLFSDLKSILRENNNVLIVWPVVNEEFANKAIGLIKSIGGMSSLAHEPVVKYEGLDVNKYYHVLERMLRIHNVVLDDFGISIDEARAVQYSGVTIGEFLNEINNLIIKKTQLELPNFGFDKLIFSISSSTDDLLNVARELRRGDTFYLEASRLLLNTRDSKIAEWWKNRNDDPQTSLAYVINLFQAELTTEYEVASKGVIADVVVTSDSQKYNIEFHHKSFNNYNPNKVAIYILEKLKEYAIAYGIASR